jgi:membrane-bound ClpP family serine protease
MDDRPTIGAVGRAFGALAPDGQAEFDGVSFPARAREANIDAGLPVVVTGFDPWFLIVRPATPEEAAARPQPTAQTTPNPASGGVLTVLGSVVFVLGVGLLIGNVTGIFPTLPFAGFVVMTIGGAMVGAGSRGREQG